MRESKQLSSYCKNSNPVLLLGESVLMNFFVDLAVSRVLSVAIISSQRLRRIRKDTAFLYGEIPETRTCKNMMRALVGTGHAVSLQSCRHLIDPTGQKVFSSA